MVERTFYYLDDFTDEVMPCDPTLEGWAEWLSDDVDGEWGRTGPEAAGTRYAASVVDLIATIEVRSDTAVETADDIAALTLPVLPAGTQYVYLRHGPGLGWDPELSAHLDFHTEEQFHDEIRRLVSPLQAGESAWLACCADRPRCIVALEQTPDGFRCVVEGSVN